MNKNLTPLEVLRFTWRALGCTRLPSPNHQTQASTMNIQWNNLKLKMPGEGLSYCSLDHSNCRKMHLLISWRVDKTGIQSTHGAQMRPPQSLPSPDHPQLFQSSQGWVPFPLSSCASSQAKCLPHKKAFSWREPTFFCIIFILFLFYLFVCMPVCWESTPGSHALQTSSLPLSYTSTPEPCILNSQIRQENTGVNPQATVRW